MMLRKCGVQVTQAWDGTEAIHAARCRPFDLILLDINMGETDGFSAARAIRSNPSATSGGGDTLVDNRATPVLAYSATASDEYKRKVVEEGLDGVLAKPCTMSMLKEALRTHVPACANL